MRSAICIGTLVFLFTASPVISQDLRDFDTTDLIGFWQTDSAAQLGAKINKRSNADSGVDKKFFDDMDRAVISREFGFFDNGMFTAQWVLGTKPKTVSGRWSIVSKDRIAIEIDEVKTEYSVKVRGKDEIMFVPLRDPHGEVHELYFKKRRDI